MNTTAPVARAVKPHHEAAPVNLRAWIAAGVGVAVIAIAMGGTFQSLFWLWVRSNTFAHGLVIVPITAWLIWRERKELARLEVKPEPLAVILVLALSLLWFVSRMAGALVMEELCAILCVIAAPLAVLGPTIFRHIIYPLGFLLLAVPFGEWLIAPLMEFTADFAVAALRAIGMPVLREGLYFSIPSGDFLVAEACSGIRYVMASVTTGALYAYLALRSPWRRAALIAISAVLPVVANGIRALGIVLLAHVTDMRLAVGADHLIYGWLFFGVVAVLILWIGTLLREPHGEPETLHPASTPAEPLSTVRVAVVAILLCSAAIVGPTLWIGQAARLASLQSTFLPRLPAARESWSRQPLAVPTAGPQFNGADAQVSARYSSAGGTVEVWVAYYEMERPGHELIHDGNHFFDGRRYGLVSRGRAIASETADTPPATALRLRGADGDWLVWYWYQVGRIETDSPIYVKLLTALDAASLPYEGRAAVALYTRVEPDAGAAPEQQLRSFLQTFRSPLASCTTATGGAGCIEDDTFADGR